MMSRVLFLSGRVDDARLLSQMLRGLPLLMDAVDGVQQARAQLPREEYQVVLTEAALPDGNWLDVLHAVRDCPHAASVIVTSAQADAALWAEALNLGAYDVLAQPFYEPEVRRILSNACGHRPHWERAVAAV